jgi:uncharacterized repeat protein (TIGR01451 family)
VNKPLIYTITVANGGPSAATGVTVTDTLPAGVTFVSATPSQGSCTGTGTVSCNLGTLARAATATVNIGVKPTKTNRRMTITNRATVAGTEFDPNTANNTATAVTTIR